MLSHYPTSVRRAPIPLLLVVAVHLAVVAALIAGLQLHQAPAPPPSMVTRVFQDPPPRVDKVDLPDPTWHTVPLTLEPPPVPEIPNDPPEVLPGQIDVPSISTIAPPGEPQPRVVGAALDPRFPLTQPPYPMGALRAGDEGAVALKVLVGTDGRVRDAQVVQSSGSGLLDQAAVNEARRHWRLHPATRAGVPFESWYTLRVVFRIEGHR